MRETGQVHIVRKKKEETTKTSAKMLSREKQSLGERFSKIQINMLENIFYVDARYRKHAIEIIFSYSTFNLSSIVT